MFIDSHTHLSRNQFDHDRPELLEQMRMAGVGRILEIPIDFDSNYVMREKLRIFPETKFAVGVHPTRLEQPEDCDGWMEHFRKLALLDDSAAIGEVGLDHHVPGSEDTWGLQEEWFHRFIDLAREVDLPLVLHIRQAHEDAMRILLQHGNHYRGVVHCFDGSIEGAEEFMDLGFYLGVGGKMTRESRGLAEVVRQIPLDRILLETDCPFLTPNPLSGRNSPVNIPLIAQMIADLKGIDVSVVEKITTRNAETLFGFTTD